MKFIEIKLVNMANADNALVIGALWPHGPEQSQLFSDSERLHMLMQECFQRDGSFLIPDSEGKTQYFGAALMAQTVLEARVVELPDTVADAA